MKVTKKDLLFLVVVGSLILVIVLISGEIRTARVPDDPAHQSAYEALERTGSRREAEKGCEACHNVMMNPLPAKHPSGNRCLLCHRMERTWR